MEIHNNLDLLKNQILNARAQMLASATQEMELEAFFYWNSQTKQLLIYDGEKWVDATSQGIIYSEGTGITIGDDNTINVKIASTSEKGIVQFATDDEVTTGTATDKVITPKQLKDSLPKNVSDLNDDTSTYPVDKADTLTGLNSTVTELNQLHESNVTTADLQKLHNAGSANGVATLDENGLVPSTQLPGFVDDVIEINTISATAPTTCAKGDKYYNSASAKIFTATATNTWGTTGQTPETDAIYVTKDTNMSYRWSGSALVQIGADKLKGYTQVLTGDGTTTQYTLNHNLGTRDVTIEVYRNSSPYDKIYPEILHTDTATATLRFSPAPASGVAYKSVVLAIGT